MKYRYILNVQGIKRELSPVGVDKLKLVTERERDQVFYRTKLSGSIKLVKADFKVLLNIENSEDRCTELSLDIEEHCTGVWQTRWQGYFSCNDVKWDLAKSECTFTPLPNDKYRAILENYSKPFNILKNPTTYTVSAKLDLTADFEFAGGTDTEAPDSSGTWSMFLAGTYWIKGVGAQRGTRFNQWLYFRLVRTAPYVNGEVQELNGWQIVEEDEANQRAKYAKMPDLYNFSPYRWDSQGAWNRYPELIQLPCGSSYDTAKYIDVSKWVNDCGTNCWNIREKINQARCRKVLWEFGKFTFDRNRGFLDTVRFLVNETTGDSTLLPASNTALSRFFSEPTNYVTGRTNELTGLLLAAKSDIVGYTSSEAATRQELSLKQLLESSRNLFRVFWDIDPLGKFRLEHESFYQLQGIEDLTVYTRFVEGTASYEYEKSKMPRFQRLKFNDANNPDFEKGEIEYGGVCVTKEEGQDTEEILENNVTTDLEYLIVSGGGTAQRGVVLLCHQNGEVFKTVGDYSGTLLPNAPLSAANLVRDYHTHSRVLSNGLVNGKVKTFPSVLKSKKQKTFKVPVCCDTINPYGQFITTLGNKGELDSMAFSLSDGTAEFTILHESTGKGALNLGRQFSDSFDLSFN